MRVCIDTRSFTARPHGVGLYIYNLCKSLLSHPEIKLILLVNKNSPLLEDEDFAGIEKIITRFGRFSLPGIFLLGKTIRRHRIDVFHIPDFFITFNTKAAVVLTIHDLIHLKFPGDYTVFHRLYYEFLLKRFARKAGMVITVSENSGRDIREWLGTDNIRVIYNGINGSFTPSLGLTDIFYTYKLGRNYILFVGNNRPHKNLYRLLEAYARLKDKYPELPCLVAVTRKDKKLESFITENFLADDVKIINDISEDDMVLLYSYSLFLVLPSLYEGFGLPLAEARACGCPVTCSDTSCMPEICGETAIYFDPYRVESIMEAMEKMYLTPSLREKLSLKGRERARVFSWKKTASETVEIYKAVNSDKR